MGPSVPIRWQGWALTTAYVAVVVGLALWLKDHPLQMLPALVLPTVGFLVVSCRTTRGGCRWRSGEEE
ncbi:MAG TPA: hypothetical protein VH392_05670 [Sphingomicrobium sp.]|jgi:hypothetical protein